MKNITTIFDIFQTFLSDEEVKKVSESLGYIDTARKFTLYDLVKQDLNVKRLFGTTQNAVYNQIFISLMTYVLLQFTYVETTKNLKYVKLSLIQFIRKLINNKHTIEVYVSINLFLKNIKIS